MSTFYPDADHSAYGGLVETVWRRRFTALIVVGVHVQTAYRDLWTGTGFAGALDEVISGGPGDRRQLARDPAFHAWLNLTLAEVHRLQSGTTGDMTELVELLADFRATRDRINARRHRALHIDGTPIAVQRFDIDPLIARVTPPSYQFPREESRRHELERAGHSLAFFTDVATVALRRIQSAWPECFHSIADLVKILGYLPDADFRSCSAWRYAGVIYVTARDSSILDLEESLIHEAGHQLLYLIDEAGRLTRDSGIDAGRDYTLPWSGKLRNFYGYFHAFYIYLLLAKYFDRVVSSQNGAHSARECDRAHARMLVILQGLDTAVTDFEANPSFTEAGARLFAALKVEVHQLVAKHLTRPVETLRSAAATH